MNIVFFDRNPEMIVAWQQHFSSIENISYHLGDFRVIKVDPSRTAIVSPANSFGIMNGGIDLAYSEYFGWNLQEGVQGIIQEKYNGELLVGQSFLIETYHEKIPYLLVAPTMRLPMHSHETPNAYLAMKTLLQTAISQQVENLLICGLCTGAGQMSFTRCAQQMWMAYDEVINNKPIKINSIQTGYEHFMSLLK